VPRSEEQQTGLRNYSAAYSLQRTDARSDRASIGLLVFGNILQLQAEAESQ